MEQTTRHLITGHPIEPPFPDHLSLALFGMGCFWGAERRFWQLPGVYITAVGYSGGTRPQPGYKDVCSGTTGHSEVVRVVFDEKTLNYPQLLKVFWESHNPTQGMRQGNDIGSQYRSGIYTYSQEQMNLALSSREAYQSRLDLAGLNRITTEIKPAEEFYYAEEYHQQYLTKNPGGYCGLGGTGVKFK